MTTPLLPVDPCHIFLEKFQKYMSVYTDTGLKHLTDYTYVNSAVTHAQNPSFVVQSNLIKNKLMAFDVWLKNLPGITPEDLGAVEALVLKNRGMSFWLPQLKITPTQENANKYTVGIKEMMTESLAAIEEFNKNTDEIKAIIKKYKPGNNAFMQSSRPVITLASLLPAKIKLSKSVIDTISLCINEPTTVMSSIKTLKDAKADTSGLFFIYHVNTKDNTNDGFVGADKYYAPLSGAEIFYDGAKAQRSARARGIKSYQIWEASLDFKKSIHQTPDFASGPTMTSIVSSQERELIEKAIATKEYQKMQEQLKSYEEILRNNNLLPSLDNSNNSSSPNPSRKSNKI